MPPKKKAAGVHLETLGDVNKALRELAELSCREADFTSYLNERINEAKADWEKDVAPIKARWKELDGAINGFLLLNHGDLFREKKTRDLTFGVLTCRKTSSVEPTSRKISMQQVLEKLREKGYTEAINTKESVNKAVMLTWPDAKLSEVCMTRKTRDVLGYEVKMEQPEMNQLA